MIFWVRSRIKKTDRDDLQKIISPFINFTSTNYLNYLVKMDPDPIILHENH